MNHYANYAVPDYMVGIGYADILSNLAGVVSREYRGQLRRAREHINAGEYSWGLCVLNTLDNSFACHPGAERYVLEQLISINHLLGGKS